MDELINGIWENMDHGFKALVIKLTQMCNMKCAYCPHAQDGNDLVKLHDNKTIPEEVAFDGIDVFLNHVAHSGSLDIVFFGGEPLLAFSLIKRIVKYVESRAKGRDITFNITTNALMVTDEMVRFLSNHKFSVCVSIDGPKEAHDANRKNRGGKGTFDRVMTNYRKLKQSFERTHSKVLVNAVLDKRCSIPDFESFFHGDDFHGITIFPNLVDDSASKEKITISQDFAWRTNYMKYLVLLSIKKRISPNSLPLAAEMFSGRMFTLNRRLRTGAPGEISVPEKIQELFDGKNVLFLGNEGDFYLGTSVNEKNVNLIIGNVVNGVRKTSLEIMIEKCSMYLKACVNCPYFTICDLTLSTCLEAQGDKEILKKSQCWSFIEMYGALRGIKHLSEDKFSYSGMPFGHHPEGVIGGVIKEVNEVGKSSNSGELLKLVRMVSRGRLPSNMDENLLLPLTMLSPLELAELTYIVESFYHVHLLQDDLLNYGFCTLREIEQAIKKAGGELL